MTNYVDTPFHGDILPYITTSLTTSSHKKIHEWIRVNPVFTQGALLKLLNVPPGNVPSVSAELQSTVLPMFGVRGETDNGARVYFSRKRSVLSPTFSVDREGACDGTPSTNPATDQVEVAQEWLRACCVKTQSVNDRMTSYQMKHLAEAWTTKILHYANATQRNENTGETYQDPRFYISNGAMISALILEGYRVVRVKFQPHFVRAFLSVRREDKRGRPPGSTLDQLVPVPAVSVSAHQGEHVLKRLRRFLDKWKGYYQSPTFKIQEAARTCGIPCHGTTPPRWFTGVLENEGCVRHVFWFDHTKPDGKVVKKQKVRWCRFVDMPKVWQEAHAKKRPVVRQEVHTQESSSEPEDTDNEEHV